MRNREQWKSKFGFTLAAVGSAVGLANIWRFPYVVGTGGGAAFILTYLFCLVLIGVPTLVAELLLGRASRRGPVGAFRNLGRGKSWRFMGIVVVCTGFLVSTFYSVVAGWIFGYLIMAIQGTLSSVSSSEQAAHIFDHFVKNSWESVFYHGAFLFLCVWIVRAGVRGGIERSSKWVMPVLFGILLLLAVYGLFLPGAGEALDFLFRPDWSALTPAVVLIALGQAFFTLSLGQGTMVTYGSYLKDDSNIPTAALPIAGADTLISLLAGVAVFTIVFSLGAAPEAGEGLLFVTLPLVFSQMLGGQVLAILFFFLVFFAAVTSEISALEPPIAYLIDEWGWERKKAVTLVGSGAFLLGIPCALSMGPLADLTLFGFTFLEGIMFLAQAILIPLGGLAAVLLLGWRWGLDLAFVELKKGAEDFFRRYPWLESYFRFGIRYVAPTLILLVFVESLLG